MTRINEIRKIIENSPQLSFNVTARITSHTDGVRNTFCVKKECIVDYTRETAKIFTDISGIDGDSQMKEFYHDKEKSISFHGSTNELSENGIQKFSQEEYSSLFAEKGELRIVDLDYIVPHSSDFTDGRTSGFKAEMPVGDHNLLFGDMKPNENVEMFSDILITVCSDDTLKINSLSCGVAKDKDGVLVTADTEIIIHLCDEYKLEF